jgi:hypothetical protein
MCLDIVTEADAKEVLLSGGVTELSVESIREQNTYVAI